jgi:cysteine desulfurase/selenocysteine lyase
VRIDVGQIRKDFPILTRSVRDGRPLVYLDSANTSQKPLQVIDAIEEFYSRHNANIHRATHQLGEEATEAYEGARLKVAGFIGAEDESEVVFTKNISEGINLVAYAMGNAATAGPEAERFRVGPGDEIVITEMEHHSNIVPWQLLAQRTGATLRWFGVTDDGRLDLSNIDELINERTKIVALAHQSNVLGTVNPVREVAAKAHAAGALVLVDGAQAVPQMPVDVQDLGADFYGFTAHKLCGPTGIGVLWGRRELLETLPPFLGGGEMIETVAMERSTYAPPPHKFEAGTMPIAEAAGLSAAIDYLRDIGLEEIHTYEHELLEYALAQLRDVDGLRLLGPAEATDRGGALSFTLDGLDGREIHPHDVSQVLDAHGVAVRAGHHCARPLHRRFGLTASTRASLYFYNTRAEVDALADGLRQTQKFFGAA